MPSKIKRYSCLNKEKNAYRRIKCDQICSVVQAADSIYASGFNIELFSSYRLRRAQGSQGCQWSAQSKTTIKEDATEHKSPLQPRIDHCVHNVCVVSGGKSNFSAKLPRHLSAKIGTCLTSKLQNFRNLAWNSLFHSIRPNFEKKRAQ